MTEHEKVMVKIYPFNNYRDNVLKNALYEIYLYKLMPRSPLKDFYVIERGRPMSIVMIFESYTCSLFDLTVYRSLANCPWTRLEVVYIAEQLIKGMRKPIMLRLQGYLLEQCCPSRYSGFKDFPQSQEPRPQD